MCNSVIVSRHLKLFSYYQLAMCSEGYQHLDFLELRSMKNRYGVRPAILGTILGSNRGRTIKFQKRYYNGCRLEFLINSASGKSNAH
jgi:hypothetical protein